MSGGHVPYHLRQNKYIERQLFLDLLSRIHRVRSLSKHSYIGFGGPSLEDFKIVHSYFDIKKMVSIEEDIEIYKRQKFNMPVKCIECEQESSADYIDSYTAINNAIFWLDYSSPDPLSQLQEFQALLPKLLPYDVVKITLNANIETVSPTEPGVPHDDLATERRAKLETKLGDLLPADITPFAMTSKGYADLLRTTTRYAANQAMAGRDEIFYPLAAFTYADSTHRMVTFTGIVIPERDVRAFLRNTTIAKWNFRYRDDRPPVNIVVPTLTIREKLFIDSQLPAGRGGAKKIQRGLKFRFDEKEEQSLEMLKNYMALYREYPNFSEIFV